LDCIAGCRIWYRGALYGFCSEFAVFRPSPIPREDHLHGRKESVDFFNLNGIGKSAREGSSLVTGAY